MCNHTHLVTLKDGRRVPVPCGFCAVCRAQRRDEWQKRLEIECLYNEKKGYGNTFLTLTCDDDHPIPYGDEKRVIQLFWKRVHKSLPAGANPKFKYFLVSEYGTLHGRLHYHAIVCGLDYSLHASAFRKAWPYGFISSCPIRDGAIRYVLKYLEKSLTNKRESEIYAKQGLAPPFRLVSKGIALDFFLANQFNLRDSNGMYFWHGKECLAPEFIRRGFGIRSHRNVFNVNASKEMRSKIANEHKLIARERQNAQPVYDFKDCEILTGRQPPQ